MIFQSINYVAEEMNEYFRNRLKIAEDKIVLSSLVNSDGSVAIQGENKVAITLINIEREINGKGNGQVLGGQSINKTNTANINLYLMFSAYFSAANYGEALRFLSFIIAYFQSHSVFTKENSPNLASGIDKLIFEMVTYSPEQLSNIWGMIGGKYMPSVVYKMRMLSFDDAIIKEIRPVTSNVSPLLQ